MTTLQWPKETSPQQNICRYLGLYLETVQQSVHMMKSSNMNILSFLLKVRQVGPVIVKEPPALPKPRKVPELVPQEVPEPEPTCRRILSYKRSLQAVTALAITVGVLILAVIVSVVVLVKTNTKGRPTYINIFLPIKDVSCCFLLSIRK